MVIPPIVVVPVIAVVPVVVPIVVPIVPHIVVMIVPPVAPLVPVRNSVWPIARPSLPAATLARTARTSVVARPESFAAAALAWSRRPVTRSNLLTTTALTRTARASVIAG